MLIELRQVPRRERHLLFCTDPALRPGRVPFAEPVDPLAAISRSLAALGESIGELWPIEAASDDLFDILIPVS